MIRQPYSPAVW